MIIGLYAPPQGTPSTTSRKASNSCRPQNAGTALDGPASPPDGACTPGTSASAEAMSVAPRACSSGACTTLTPAGTRSTGSGRLDVVTSTVGSCFTGVWAWAAMPGPRRAAAARRDVRMRGL